MPTPAPTATTPKPSFWRVLLKRRGVWVLFALLVLVVGGGWLSVSKLWRTSPPGAEPVVKVSLVDLLQSRSLAATARRLAAEGDAAGAFEAWRAAVANNQGNPELWRALFRHLADSPVLPREDVAPALGNLGWFTLITLTNTADLTLGAEVCAKYEAFEPLLVLPGLEAHESAARLQALRLEGLFRVGRMIEFKPLFERLRDGLKAEPGGALLEAAYLAGWGPLATRATNRVRLQAALEDPAQRVRAAKLDLIVANHLADPKGARHAIEILAEEKQASGLDQALWWLTLARTGGRDEARKLAAEFLGAPTSATELNMLVRAWAELGMAERAGEYLSRYAPRLGLARTPESAHVWLGWATLLIRGEDWVGLRRLAEGLRTLPGKPDWLAGYADFLEGYAAHQSAQGPLAADRLRRAAGASYPVGSLAVTVADGLLEVGYVQEAAALLAPLRSRFEHDPGYWRVVWNVTLRLQSDDDLLLTAATRLHELEPDDPVARFNLAAALLIRNERPAEALKLLFGFRSNTPKNLYTELNYAMALVRNDRLEDARDVLSAIDVTRLTDVEKPTYYLIRAEQYQRAGDPLRARRALEAINPDGFFPCQRRHLEELTRRLTDQP